MNPGIVQRIFNDHFYKLSRNKILHSREKNAAVSIMTCRTPVQGYHIDACPNDDYQTIALNSCRHRACPQCGATGTQLWLERRKAQALDCPYFQVIFTISHDLHTIWRYNRKLFTNQDFTQKRSWNFRKWSIHGPLLRSGSENGKNG